jgi:hypothetical protein
MGGVILDNDGAFGSFPVDILRYLPCIPAGVSVGRENWLLGNWLMHTRRSSRHC